MITSPSSVNIMGCHGVYKIKRQADGSPEHYKAWLVEKRVFINKIPSTSMRHLTQLLNMQPFMLSCPWMPPYNELLNK